MTIEAKRAARRAAMPTVTAILAEYAAFAPTVVFASENGITVGKEPDYSGAFTVPAGYAPMWKPEAKK
jgi:hypothetical protein